MGTPLSAHRLAAVPIRRADRLGLVALALVVAFGMATSVGCLNAAVRTRDAHRDYVERANVADLVINPSAFTADMDRAIRKFTGVTSLTSDTLFLSLVLPDGTTVNDVVEGGIDSTAERAQSFIQVRGSTDGRYLVSDEPVIERGRTARGRNEIFLTHDLVPVVEKVTGHPVRIGDDLSVGFAAQNPDGSVAPISVEHLTVSGIGRLADESVPDDLYPRQRAIVSPDVARRLGCLPDVRPGMSQQEVVAAFFQPDCSSGYRYYSMRLTGGTAGASRVIEQFNRAATQLRPALAPLGEGGADYFLIANNRSIDDRRVERAVQPTVTSLALFGVVTGLGTLVMAGLMIVRLVRRHRRTLDIERTIGFTRSGRSTSVLIALWPAVVTGVLSGVVFAWATSEIAPLGIARTLDPDPGRSLSWSVTLGAVAVTVVTMIATVGAAAAARSRPGRPRRSPRPWWPARSNHPERDVGLRAALGGSGSSNAVVTLGACALATATIVTAVVFGTNLDRVVTTPSEFGSTWDALAITGSGYGDANLAAISKDLDGRDDVESWAPAAVDSGAVIRGRAVPAVLGRSDFTDHAPPAAEGRLPHGPDEIALGRVTADELGLAVGDVTTITSDLLPAPRRVEVVGLVVTAPLGQFVADRSGLGVGAYLEAGDDFDPGSYSMVAIRTAGGRTGRDLIADLGGQVDQWDTGSPSALPLVRTSPVRPPEIVDGGELVRVPSLVGLAIGLSTIVGLGLMVLLSVRDRRRELATLRVLGFSGSQLRTSVRWQVVVTMVVGLVIGIPAGWIGGRWAWIRFSTGLGSRSIVVFPTVWIVAIAIAAVLAALAVSVVPGRRATRSGAMDLTAS